MAHRRFGNTTLQKEECREARNLAWLENIVQDFRHSFRTLRRNSGFTAVAVLTLAVGIGATAGSVSALVWFFNGVSMGLRPTHDNENTPIATCNL